MTVIDNTFTRIVLRAPQNNRARPWVYYRHPEHGGLVDDPLFADHIQHIDDFIWKCEDWARQHWPDKEWQRARLIVDVQPFHSLDSLDKVISVHVREAALKKLTDHERRVLGL